MAGPAHPRVPGLTVPEDLLKECGSFRKVIRKEGRDDAA